VPEERTALAWQRTGLGMLAVAGLVAHSGVRHGEPVFFVLAGVSALLGLGVLGGLTPLRYRQVRERLAAGTYTGSRKIVAAVTLANIVVGLTALVTAAGLALR
jgi:putative membrane protein